MIRITDVVKHLLIINVLTFVVFKFLFPYLSEYVSLYFPTSSMFRPYQIVSHMFMHADMMHLFFNLFALWMFGSAVEANWGVRKTLTYYLITSFGAAALHLGVKYLTYQGMVSQLSPDQIFTAQEEGRALILSGRNYLGLLGDFNLLVNVPAVGASGAVYGILLAFGMLYPNHKIFLIFFPVPIAAKYFIPVMMLGELYLGVNNFAWDNVAHFAHLGGALVGFLLIMFWRKFPNKLS